MNERNRYLAVIQSAECREWLGHVLAEQGEVVSGESQSLDRLLQLIDAIGIAAVFVQLTADKYRQEATLIEGLVAAKPLLPILVVADNFDQERLLAAMRAGARDYLTIGARSSEVIGVIKHLLPREMAGSRKGHGDSNSCITAVVSARPGNDSPMLALHLALAMQETKPTLLLDLGVPYGDTLLYLGIDASYNFIDAVRNLHRIDATLIQTGFGNHKSGLTVLSMPETPDGNAQFASADVYVLLRALLHYFPQIVLNLGGLPPSDFLNLLLGNADRMVLLVEQSVPSCRHNLNLLKQMRDGQISLENAGIVVDRYLPHMPPDAESIAKSFGLPLMGTLPPSGMARLATMNSGESMFTLSPSEPYVQNVRRLARQLLTGQVDPAQQEKVGLLGRLLTGLQPMRIARSE